MSTADWDFYLVRADGSSMAIALDLGAEPNGERIAVRVKVPMKNPREDGLRSADEFDELAELEDEITSSIAEAGGIQVGRVQFRGAMDYAYYAPAWTSADEQRLEAVLAGRGTYSSSDDPEWSYFTEFLFPDPYSLQRIWNRRLLDQLIANGDDPTVERSLDHLALFASQADAGAAAGSLSDKGYSAEPPRLENGRWQLAFVSTGPVTLPEVGSVTDAILEVVLRLDGVYDGWGCMVQGADE